MEAPAGREMVGLKGFEPLTLRLSSACSNQLSYRPEKIPDRRGRKIGEEELARRAVRATRIAFQKVYVDCERVALYKTGAA